MHRRGGSTETLELGDSLGDIGEPLASRLPFTSAAAKRPGATCRQLLPLQRCACGPCCCFAGLRCLHCCPAFRPLHQTMVRCLPAGVGTRLELLPADLAHGAPGAWVWLVSAFKTPPKAQVGSWGVNWGMRVNGGCMYRLGTAFLWACMAEQRQVQPSAACKYLPDKLHSAMHKLAPDSPAAIASTHLAAQPVASDVTPAALTGGRVLVATEARSHSGAAAAAAVALRAAPGARADDMRTPVVPRALHPGADDLSVRFWLVGGLLARRSYCYACRAPVLPLWAASEASYCYACCPTPVVLCAWHSPVRCQAGTGMHLSSQCLMRPTIRFAGWQIKQAAS